MNEVTEATWRRRFVWINLARIGGTALVLFALLLWQTDRIVVGGLPVTGFLLALAGLVASFFAPRWLARRWKARDRG